MLVVNLPVYDDALGDLVAATDLPVLQDTSDNDMGERWGASKSYVYVLDASAHPAYIHYTLSFTNDIDRLLQEVEAARGGGS